MAICVTGGSGGVGRAIAERLATPGDHVFLGYAHTEPAAQEAAAVIAARGARPHLIKSDLGSAGGARDFVAAVAAVVDRVDVVVHSAVRAVPGPVLEMDAGLLDDLVAVNGTSLVHLTREALPLLGRGSVVLYVTSAGASRVNPSYGGIGGPKAMAEHFMRYLAFELGPRGVRINAIAPGPLDTAARRAMFPDTWAERLADQNSRNPSGRGVGFDDVANAVELLVRPEFSMVHGQVLRIDGGLSLS